jgi:hypothetical protein
MKIHQYYGILYWGPKEEDSQGQALTYRAGTKEHQELKKFHMELIGAKRSVLMLYSFHLWGRNGA